MSIGHKLMWYIKRLSVMRPAEIIYRLNEQVGLFFLRIKYMLGRSSTSPVQDIRKFGFCTADRAVLPEPVWQTDRLVRDDVLSGKWSALGFDWSWTPTRDAWHKAPDTGCSWPLKFFHSIACRSGNPYGDARVIWEPARLQQLVALALVAKETDAVQRMQATQLLEAQFLSWCEENPAHCGIHYVSAMECALRLIAVCHALDGVRADLEQTEKVWSAVVSLVELHASLISKRLSLHSSAGNHTLAECAGLVYAGVLFPELDQAGKWKADGLALFELEIDRQVLPDGGGREQSTWYLLFITDLCGLLIGLLEHIEGSAPGKLVDAFQRARQYLGALAESPGTLPQLGDADSGYALSACLSISFPDPDAVEPGVKTFSATGCTVVRLQEEGQLLMDHGNLGMLPACGHGHADALSIIYSPGNQSLLVDPGTYTYTGEPVWRHYFRSTRAHNTICIDDLDQARQSAPFMWAGSYDAELVRQEETPDGEILLLAKHNGYARQVGVMHWRGVCLMPGKQLLIWDFLEGEGEHALEFNWHTPAEVSDDAAGYRLETVAGMKIQLLLDERLTKSVHCGSVDPILGWQSKVYGVRYPINTIQGKVTCQLPASFSTRFAFLNCSLDGAYSDERKEKFKEWITNHLSE